MVTALLLPVDATAQTEGKFALGASLSAKQHVGSGAGTYFGPSLLWRIGQGKEGFGFKLGTNWYSTELRGDVGGQAMALGKLHIRPIMLGYGYTHLMGRTKISANVLGGYAFTSFSFHPDTESAYRARVGLTPSMDTSNALVVKPEMSIWYDLTPKVGLNFNVGYMFARPSVSIPTLIGNAQQRMNADIFMVKMGVAYSLF